MREIVRARAPLRVSFFGGATDVPPYSHEHGGCVLSATIDSYVTTTLKPSAEGICVSSYINSFDLNIDARLDDFNITSDKDPLALEKAALAYFQPIDKISLTVQSPVPMRSGLGTSSSAMVSMIKALSAYKKTVPLKKQEIADLAFKLERENAKQKGGFQDQYAAAYGGFNWIEYDLAEKRIIVTPLKLHEAFIDELHHHLLLVHTGETREGVDAIQQQMNAYAKGQNVQHLDDMKRIAFEGKKALLLEDLTHFAGLMHESWEAKKCVATSITNEKIDYLYKIARENGAVGGKLLGAGGGGYLLLFCKDGTQQKVARAVINEGATPRSFYFESRGAHKWRP